MPDVLDRTVGPLAPALPDERSARRTLLDQVARLENELSQVFCSTWPRTNVPRPLVAGRGGGARLLSFAELEELRDEKAPAERWNPSAHGQRETGRLEP